MCDGKWKETFQTHWYLLTLSTAYFDGDYFLFIDINQSMFRLYFLLFRSQYCWYNDWTGKILHAVLGLFLSCIHINSLVDGRMCLILSKHFEDTIIKLKHECKKCAFCCFLLHRYITMHGSKNVQL